MYKYNSGIFLIVLNNNATKPFGFLSSFSFFFPMYYSIIQYLSVPNTPILYQFTYYYYYIYIYIYIYITVAILFLCYQTLPTVLDLEN